MSRSLFLLSIVALWGCVWGCTIYPPGALFLPTDEEQAAAVAAAIANPDAGYRRVPAGQLYSGDFGSGSDFGAAYGWGEPGQSSGGSTTESMPSSGNSSAGAGSSAASGPGGMSVTNTLPSIASLTFHQSLVTEGRVYGSFSATLADDTPSESYTIEIEADDSVISDGNDSFYVVDDHLAGTVMTVRARVIEFVNSSWQSTDSTVYGEWQQFTVSDSVGGMGVGGMVGSSTGGASTNAGTAYSTPRPPTQLQAAPQVELEQREEELYNQIGRMQHQIARLGEPGLASHDWHLREWYRSKVSEWGRELSEVQRQLGRTPTGGLVTGTPDEGAFGPQQTFGGNHAAAWREPWVRRGQIGCVVVGGSAAAGAGAMTYAGVNVVLWGTATTTAATAAETAAVAEALVAAEAAAAAVGSGVVVATEAEAVIAFGGEAAFGRLLAWGVGRAGAIERLGMITLAELQTAGITLPIARYWLQFYQQAVVDGRGADTSAARAALFARIIELLGG